MEAVWGGGAAAAPGVPLPGPGCAAEASMSPIRAQAWQSTAEKKKKRGNTPTLLCWVISYLQSVVTQFKDVHFPGAVSYSHSLCFVNRYETHSEHCQIWPTQSVPLQGVLEPSFISRLHVCGRLCKPFVQSDPGTCPLHAKANVRSIVHNARRGP